MCSVIAIQILDAVLFSSGNQNLPQSDQALIPPCMSHRSEMHNYAGLQGLQAVRAPRGTQGLILFATAGNEVTKTPSFEAFGIGEFIEFRYGSRPF